MRCAKCGTKLRGGGYPSPLGETVCQRCHDTIAGAAVGLASGGGLGGALAGPGLLTWISDALHPGRRAERKAAEARARETTEQG